MDKPAGATYLADDLSHNGAAAQKRFIDLLSAGGSDYPYTLFKKAGIELRKRRSSTALLEGAMNKIMDEMENCWPRSRAPPRKPFAFEANIGVDLSLRHNEARQCRCPRPG